MTISRIPALVLLISLTALLGCAGYQLGSQTLYRQDIRSVYVPMFESDSFRRFLGEQLTEAVVKRIEKVTPYKVVSNPGADSVLSGRIVSETKRIVTENAYDDGRDVEATFRVEVSWTDRSGQVLGQNSAFPLPPSLVVINQSAQFLPEGGQSLGTAQREAIQRLAKQIVDQMEMPW